MALFDGVRNEMGMIEGRIDGLVGAPGPLRAWFRTITGTHPPVPAAALFRPQAFPTLPAGLPQIPSIGGGYKFPPVAAAAPITGGPRGPLNFQQAMAANAGYPSVAASAPITGAGGRTASVQGLNYETHAPQIVNGYRLEGAPTAIASVNGFRLTN